MNREDIKIDEKLKGLVSIEDYYWKQVSEEERKIFTLSWWYPAFEGYIIRCEYCYYDCDWNNLKIDDSLRTVCWECMRIYDQCKNRKHSLVDL